MRNKNNTFISNGVPLQVKRRKMSFIFLFFLLFFLQKKKKRKELSASKVFQSTQNFLRFVCFERFGI